MAETRTITQNRKAFHDYFVEEKYEAGIALFGTEIKSIRHGNVNLKDSYCSFEKGEIFETPLFTVGFTNGGFEKMTETLYDYQYDFLLPQEKIKNEFAVEVEIIPQNSPVKYIY